MLYLWGSGLQIISMSGCGLRVHLLAALPSCSWSAVMSTTTLSTSIDTVRRPLVKSIFHL